MGEKKQRVHRVIAVGRLSFGEDGVLQMPANMSPGQSPMDSLVKSSVRCVVCGAGFGKCDCFVQCACGWSYEKGAECDNDVHRCPRERGGMRCAFRIGHEEPHTYVEEG